MKIFLNTLVRNFIDSFRGKKLLWHLLAIILTVIVVKTGFDWWYFSEFKTISWSPLVFPALSLGGLIPILLPIGLISYGSLHRHPRLRLVGWALGQAALLGSAVSSLYKAFTGRLQPDHINSLVDSSHLWNFGILKHGIFWGWPSSHTTIAFSMALCLIALFPKNKLLIFISFIYALYIGLSVSVSIHWFSEFMAGTIIGSVIGTTVGKSWKHLMS
ncbi:phosphatase PAP2 family protein [Candidatus Parcubacteria bacterium]|nr:phosphatase PAP2 family protein [Candidatus Parcubacteria bacterium]